MREKIPVLFTITILSVLLISGCTNKSRESSTPTTTPETGGTGGEITTTVKTYIESTGLSGNMKTRIEPTVGKQVSGIITISAIIVPDNTNAVAFSIATTGQTPEQPNLGYDNDPNDGWDYLLDTTTYDNGVYNIYAYAFDATGSGGQLDVTITQVIIQN